MFVPDLFEQVLSAEDGTGRHQRLQHREFFCGEIERSTLSASRMPQRIEFDAHSPEYVTAYLGLAAGKRPYPKQELPSEKA